MFHETDYLYVINTRITQVVLIFEEVFFEPTEL